MSSLRVRLIWLLMAAVLLTATLEARVASVEILSRTDIQEGKPFGSAGAYEKITGRVHFKIDPSNLHNRQIVDLDKAARDAQGEVEFSADFYLLRPKEMSKGNGPVLFEVSNRGGKGIIRLVNGVNAADPSQEFGDGFLMRGGYTVAWVGWEYDVSDQNQNLRLYAPLAQQIVGATNRQPNPGIDRPVSDGVIRGPIQG